MQAVEEEKTAPLSLSEEQSQIYESILTWVNNVIDGHDKRLFTVLKGCAGTGKTTLVAEVLKSIDYSIPVSVLTLTGKASSVLLQKMNDAGALEGNRQVCTIHHFMYVLLDVKDGNLVFSRVEDDEYRKGANSKIRTINDTQLIIVDESSMLSNKMIEDLKKYDIPILFVGDEKQLPPVGEHINTLFEDADWELTEVHRQALENPIIRLATEVRKKNQVPYGEWDNKVGKFKKKEQRTINLMKLFRDKMLDSSRIILTGLNKNRVRINKLTREQLGFSEYDFPQAEEKVVCLRNNKSVGIKNGQTFTVLNSRKVADTLLLLELQPDDDPELRHTCFSLTTCFNVGKAEEVADDIERDKFRAKNAVKNALDMPDNWGVGDGVNLFDYGYCLTVHKSQGSEWDKVLLVDDQKWQEKKEDNHQYFRWLYTGITRAKEGLIIVR